MNGPLPAADAFSTYRNERGFRSLKADPTGNRLGSPEGWYELSGKVWALGDAEDGQYFDEILAVIRFKALGVWNHYVVAADSGLLLATGRDVREGDSWQQARDQLVSRNIIEA